MNLVEQIGSGVGRIRDLMEEAGLPEPLFMLDGMFTVSLLRPVDFETWIIGWEDKLTDNRKKMLELIYKDTGVTKEYLSVEVGVSTTAIDNNIKWLRENGLIKRTGSDKKGKWKINYKMM